MNEFVACVSGKPLETVFAFLSFDCTLLKQGVNEADVPSDEEDSSC